MKACKFFGKYNKWYFEYQDLRPWIWKPNSRGLHFLFPPPPAPGKNYELLTCEEKNYDLLRKKREYTREEVEKMEKKRTFSLYLGGKYDFGNRGRGKNIIFGQIFTLCRICYTAGQKMEFFKSKSIFFFFLGCDRATRRYYVQYLRIQSYRLRLIDYISE